MKIRLAAASATTGALVLLAPVAAQASSTAAQWDLNEPAESTVMMDSSGNGLNGSIGSAVITGADTRSGYQFKAVPDGLKHDEQLAVVRDDPAGKLDPQSGDFSVTARFKTGAGNQNVVQKGQANMKGGYWKIDMNHGIPICLFRDSVGVISAKQWGKTIWDGKYHSVTCAKTVNAVSISVDGALAQKNVKTLGNIDNTKELSIGGKLYCSPPSVGCDYFVGVIDSVQIVRG